MNMDQRAAQLTDWISSNDLTGLDPSVILASVKLFLMAQRNEALEQAAILCRDKAKALADLALFGDTAHARRREGMEAAYKNAEHLIRSLQESIA